MKKILFFIIGAACMGGACVDANRSSQKKPFTMTAKEETTVLQTLDSLRARYDDLPVARAEKGIRQAMKLWTDNDGNEAEFIAFCLAHYVNGEAAREQLFLRLSDKFELLLGSFNKIDLELKKTIHEDIDEPLPIDYDMGGYDVSAHFKDDMFANKVAFTTVLNFPSFTLQEKQEQGESWSRLQWAYARMGDLFTARIPANVQQRVSATQTAADNYISDYNIMMGELRNDNGDALFPAGMKLLSHWNLRDELKSNYADAAHGLEKQRMIYTVMKRIVTQEIPERVINRHDVQWNPIANRVFKDGREIAAAAEPDTRYAVLLDNFHALQSVDAYTPATPSYIQRAFDGGMEFSKDEVKDMFTRFVSSAQVKQVATLIETRLGRPLEPFDIWYDGFKSRSSIPEDELTAITRRLYPNAGAFERAMPTLLQRLGFTPDEAARISDKIEVDAARGSGHAWGAAMKGDKAHLRTRIAPSGMDYKGYNIAVHEFGHNVEQTISLYDIDYYMLNGVPNTAFTEALAFLFQKRDLGLLGIRESANDKEWLTALDIFWGCYEIMGVALVDIAVWEWMYANPHATPVQLKENVLRIARELWNACYAPILGEPDSPILAIYSHMIDNPLYLANYPMGHLIEFQLEEFLRDAHFADEVTRIYRMGRLSPQWWMKRATGREVSIEPMLNAVKAR
ncbi:MAG: hypothetical protein LBF19_03530 [Prevotellaceae bacterium]|jgi:hypothetical protein|nr:hypothetical protein [Prevotellaceae bacterium]